MIDTELPLFLHASCRHQWLWVPWYVPRPGWTGFVPRPRLWHYGPPGSDDRAHLSLSRGGDPKTLGPDSKTGGLAHKSEGNNKPNPTCVAGDPVVDPMVCSAVEFCPPAAEAQHVTLGSPVPKIKSESGCGAEQERKGRGHGHPQPHVVPTAVESPSVGSNDRWWRDGAVDCSRDGTRRVVA